MSAFSSLYSSLTGDAANSVLPDRPKSTGVAPTQARPPLPAKVPSAGPVKRKADEPTSTTATKIARITPPANGITKSLPPVAVVSPQAPRSKPQTLGDQKRPALPTTQANAKSDLKVPTSRPSTTPSAAQSLNKNGAPAESSNTPKAAPPKGSYKDMLARAAQAKKLASEITTTQHKPTPKLSKRKRRAQEIEAKEKAKEAKKSGVRATDVKSGSAASKAGPGGKPAEAVKPRRQPTDLGYKGTMRQVETAPSSAKKSRGSPESKGPSNRPSEKRKPDAGGSYASRYRYVSESEDEDEEDEEDYESDNMESYGFAALEEEEEASLRMARKEDAQALQEETEHRRKKNERKKQLEALIASRKR